MIIHAKSQFLALLNLIYIIDMNAAVFGSNAESVWLGQSALPWQQYQLECLCTLFVVVLFMSLESHTQFVCTIIV